MNRGNRPRLSRVSGSSFASRLFTRAGDGSTLTLDFTTGVLDPRLTFSRSGGGSYTHSDGYLYGFDSSTTSNTIAGSGSKTFTLAAQANFNRRYNIGDTVWASNGANNMRGTVTSYNPSTQSLTFNVTGSTGSGTFTSWIIGNAMARFDYDPTTNAARGLLIEASANNLALRSNDFNSTVTDGTQWTASGYTAGTLSTTLPDGTTGNACRILMTSGSGSIRSAAITVLASTAYTFSFWARNNGGSQARFRVWNATAGSSIVDYTQSVNNYVSQIGGANNTSSTWVRVSVPFTTPAGCTSIYVYPCSSDSGTVDLLVWGAQVELGGASSYIPTGASQSTRAADSCIMTGTDFSSWFTTAGTFLVEHQLTNAFGTADRVQVSLGQYASGISAFAFFRTNATTVGAAVWGSGGTGYQEGTTSVSARTPIRSGMTLDFTGSTRSLRAFANGTTGASLVSTTGTISVDRMFLGSNGSGTSSTRDYQNGHIRSLKFWPSVLPNATLQSLTT